MKPLLEIRRLGPDAYSYRISVEGSEPQEPGCSFETLEFCVFEAACALDAEVPSVEISFEGMFMGAYAADVLRSNPKAVAQRIAQHYQAA